MIPSAADAPTYDVGRTYARSDPDVMCDDGDADEYDACRSTRSAPPTAGRIYESGRSFPTGHLSVELRGFEPLTLSMPWRCATSCAIAPELNPSRRTAGRGRCRNRTYDPFGVNEVR